MVPAIFIISLTVGKAFTLAIYTYKYFLFLYKAFTNDYLKSKCSDNEILNLNENQNQQKRENI